MENWIILSFLSALTFALVNTIDKYKIFDSINLSHPVFCIYAGISNLILGSFFVIIFPVQNATSTNIFLAVFTGILQGISIGLMFKALSQNEVTRVVPIYQTYPIYVLIIALMFLDEKLTWLQILSIILMFTGGILASLEINKKNKKINFARTNTIVILVLAAISMAISHVFLKALIDDFTTFQIFGLRGIGLSLPLVLPFISRTNMKTFYTFLIDWRSSRFLFLAETLGAFIGLILIILALNSGPVSLVAAISSGARPIFVVIIGILVSIIGKKINEQFDLYNGLLKIASAVFVGTGILLVSINL